MENELVSVLLTHAEFQDKKEGYTSRFKMVLHVSPAHPLQPVTIRWWLPQKSAGPSHFCSSESLPQAHLHFPPVFFLHPVTPVIRLFFFPSCASLLLHLCGGAQPHLNAQQARALRLLWAVLTSVKKCNHPFLLTPSNHNSRWHKKSWCAIIPETWPTWFNISFTSMQPWQLSHPVLLRQSRRSSARALFPDRQRERGRAESKGGGRNRNRPQPGDWRGGWWKKRERNQSEILLE